MGFRSRKVYGGCKKPECPFCGKDATAKNAQDLEVCVDHVDKLMEEIKCTCGSWLEMRSGKFGAYFNCLNCGNINYNKAMEMKEITMEKYKKAAPVEKKEKKKVFKRTFERPSPKEITISTNDMQYFD